LTKKGCGSLRVFNEKRHSTAAPRRSAMGSTPSTAHRLTPSQSCICSDLTKGGGFVRLFFRKNHKILSENAAGRVI